MGIWQEMQKRADPSLYQLSFSLESTEPFDREALAHSIRAISALHPLLGARLVDGGAGPAWRLGQAIPAFAPLADEAGLETWLATALRLDGPLLEVALAGRGAGPERLAVKWNHLVADGWAFGILWRDFAREYLGRLKGDICAEEISTARSYADFSAWSLAYPRSLEGLGDLGFWRAELSARPPFTSLPLRGDWPEEGAGARGSIEIPITIELPGGLPRGRSLFEHCLAAWFLVLSRFSGSDEPVVAIPCLGRPGRDFHATVGHCSNLIHLCASVGESRSFSAFLDRLSARLAQAKAHELYPAALLGQELGRASRAPLTEAYCSIVAAPPAATNSFGLGTISQAGSPWAAAFEIQKTGKKAWGVLRCPRDLWDPEVLDLLARGLASLIAAASADPDLPLSECLGLDARQRGKLQALREARVEREAGKKAGSDAQNQARSLEPPTDPALRFIHGIWAEVLGRTDIGVDDDFFRLGGSSLSALRVISRLNAATGREEASSLLFRARSLGALAAALALKPGELKRAERDARGEGPTNKQAAQPKRLSEGDASAAEGAPLGSSQTRMWFLWRMDPSDSAYTLHAALRLRGPLDASVLAEAFRLLQLRHEALRSIFPPGTEGRGLQKILGEARHTLLFHDLRRLPAAEAEQKALDLMRQNAALPWALDREPPLRFLLAALPGPEFLASMALHHIIADQWSWGIIAAELQELYAALSTGREAAPPPAALGPAAAAAREAERLASAAAARDEAFWRKELAGLQSLDLLPDRVDGGRRRAGSLRLALSEAQLSAAAARAAQAGIAPSVLYLGALALALWRRTGQGDFPIGMPSANRDERAVEGSVGSFVNSLVIRSRAESSWTLGEFLASLNASFLRAQDHRAFPYERMIELGRRAGEGLAVDVLFNLVNAPLRLPAFPGLQVMPFPMEPIAAQFSLSLIVDPLMGRTAEFVWDDSLFHAEGMRLLAASWLQALHALSGPPDARLADLGLDGGDPLTAAAAGPPLGYPRRNLAAIIQDAAAPRLGQPAILRGQAPPLSYGEVLGMAGSLAALLARKGVGMGDIVAVHLERGPGLLISLLAILSRGAAYLPIDPAYPEARKRFMATHAGARLAISWPGAAQPFGRGAGLPAILVLEGLPDPGGRLEPAELEPESAAYLLYTSGSTGTPKGLSVSHRALSNFLHSMLSQPGFSAQDRLLSVTSPSFDISGLEYWLPLLAGGSLRIASAEEARDPAALRRILKEECISVLQATPATWRLLLEGGWTEGLRAALCGGEAFPPELLGPLKERCSEVWNMYGPTETTIWSCLQRMEDDDWPLAVGKPVANTKVWVLDDALRPLPPLAPGEIWIGGEGLASGYHRSPEQTAAAFRPQPWEPGRLMYRTGDRGRFLPDGRLVCMGRADSQVKLNGHRIELGEVEALLASFPGIRQAVCDLRRGGSERAWLGAWLVMEPGRGLPAREELEAHVLKSLPPYMLPAAWGLLASVPLGPGGKVDRRALPPLAPESAAAEIPPATALEGDILRTWEAVLGRKGFGVTRDFFSLGGHSLLALRLVSAIATATGRELSLREFFSSPTVRGNSRALEGAGRAKEGKAGDVAETEVLYPMHPGGSRRPLFLVAGVYANEDGLYRHLSALVAHLGTEQPVYLLRPRGISGAAAPYASAAEAGRDFAAAIGAAQPEGPVFLAGECLGGIHAYETARHLYAAGREIGALILMDSDYPLPAATRASGHLRALAGALLLRLRSLRGLLFSGSLRRLARGLRNYLSWKRHSLFPSSPEDRRIARFDRIQRRYAALSRAYPMPSYAGRVELLLNASDAALRPALGWKDGRGRTRRGPAEISIRILPGDHVTRLADHGGETARAIRGIMDGAQ